MKEAPVGVTRHSQRFAAKGISRKVLETGRGSWIEKPYRLAAVIGQIHSPIAVPFTSAEGSITGLKKPDRYACAEARDASELPSSQNLIWYAPSRTGQALQWQIVGIADHKVVGHVES